MDNISSLTTNAALNMYSNCMAFDDVMPNMQMGSLTWPVQRGC